MKEENKDIEKNLLPVFDEPYAVEDNDEELFERFTFTVDKYQSPIRIDKFLMSRIERATRNKIQQAIKSGLILVNEKEITPNYKIKPSDEIVVYDDAEESENKVQPEKIDLQILFEDDDIIIINKKAGMVVHPGCGNYSGTLLNGIAHYLQEKNIDENKLPRFGLVHRIDKNTSGLLVLAKNMEAITHLAKQFFDHTIERKYVSIVWGDFENNEGTIEAHVGRNLRYRKKFEAYPEGDHGKAAITHYKVIERFGYTTLIECKLETGRTHQIRVHMNHIGHPVFNDDTYNGDRIVKGTVFTKYKQFVENCFSLCPRQALHAKTLGFIHPRTKKLMQFDSPIPDDMQAVIEKWRNYIAQLKKG